MTASSSDTASAMHARALVHTLEEHRDQCRERLARIETFEAALSDGAEADFEGTCHELMDFTRQVLNAQLSLIGTCQELAESSREQTAIAARVQWQLDVWCAAFARMKPAADGA